MKKEDTAVSAAVDCRLSLQAGVDTLAETLPHFLDSIWFFLDNFKTKKIFYLGKWVQQYSNLSFMSNVEHMDKHLA